MERATKFIEMVDAQEMHRLHPTTFQIPAKEEIEKIKVGQFLKCSVGGERFWNEVKKIEIIGNEYYYHCTINNDLVLTEIHGLKFGDKLIIKRENIYNILDR